MLSSVLLVDIAMIKIKVWNAQKKPQTKQRHIYLNVSLRKKPHQIQKLLIDAFSLSMAGPQQNLFSFQRINSMIHLENANIGKVSFLKPHSLKPACETAECLLLNSKAHLTSEIQKYDFSNKELLYYEGQFLFLTGDSSGSRRQVAWRDKNAFPIFH